MKRKKASRPCGGAKIPARAGARRAPRAAGPGIRAVSRAIQAHIDAKEVSGAVALAATPGGVIYFDAIGLADIARNIPMSGDTIFWIASMTKPVTACAIMMLQDEGRLSISDPASKYLPELANLRAAGGDPCKPSIKHLLTHTSGMAEATEEEFRAARAPADLIPHYASKPVQFEPGTRWQYCQSGIISLGRIVEVVSGRPFQEFLSERLFEPLGMKDTTFYPDKAQRARIAVSYKLADGRLEENRVYSVYDYKLGKDRVPAPNAGLYSTAPDYGRFCRMLLNAGRFGRRQYLTPSAVAAMSTLQTGAMKTGFTEGNGWGLGCGLVRHPQGPTAALSPGTFGHGGAYGTQAWIDPVKKVVYLLMVQRTNYPNGDASDLRRDFQAAVAKTLNPVC